MYQSTPQHVIDEESHPGVLADMLNSSSSSDNSSSSSSGDSDGSSGSNTTTKKWKRVLRGRRRRKSSASSKDTTSAPSTIRTPSTSTFTHSLNHNEIAPADSTDDHHHLGAIPALGAIASGDEADTDGERDTKSNTGLDTTITTRDFENEKGGSGNKSPEIKMKKNRKKKHRKAAKLDEKEATILENPTSREAINHNSVVGPRIPRVGFVQDVQVAAESSPKRPFNIRGLSVRDVVPAMPPMPKVLSGTVFSTANPTGGLSASGAPFTGVTPRALHRSSSLPGRLNQVQTARQQSNPPMQPQTSIVPVNSIHPIDSKDNTPPKKYMSRTSAICLLLASTGLVAVCAEFLVSSIGYLVSNTSVSEAFVGLIILPIVGNAAEHVTAVTVASKNKMDLAIGVAVGSSIQIALFVTPVIVLLGWILNKDMSLYFSLFETVSLFASAFIVNFLVLDGRSNYLEGALLIAAYVIIALAAFFFPDSGDQSTIGGADSVQRMMLKML
ncbi:Ca2+:H+ antiporter, partial [Lecanoromycetidae sp. Uapishka_2]